MLAFGTTKTKVNWYMGVFVPVCTVHTSKQNSGKYKCYHSKRKRKWAKMKHNEMVWFNG